MYDEWSINGEKPSLIKGITQPTPERSQIIISCVALRSIIGSDPRTEIAKFTTMAGRIITNRSILSGGSVVQSSGIVDKVTVTDGVDTWAGILHVPEIKEVGPAHRKIEYDLVIDIDYPGMKGNTIYMPPWTQYSNIQYNQWTSPYVEGSDNRVSKVTIQTPNLFPQTVTQLGEGADWANADAIKAMDKNFAYATNNTNTPQLSKWIVAKNFNGLNVPEGALVNILGCRIFYGNTSKKRSGFSDTRHYFEASGGNMLAKGAQYYNEGHVPETAENYWFDSRYSLSAISSSPAVYNDPDFTLKYRANLDKYKTIWLDFIYAVLWYQVNGEPLPPTPAPSGDGYELGTMTIYEKDPVTHVRVSGTGCCGPCWLEVNGVRRDWQSTHDKSFTGNTLEAYGNQVLEFPLPTPSNIITFVTSKHQYPADSCSNNKGCLPDFVELVH